MSCRIFFKNFRGRKVPMKAHAYYPDCKLLTLLCWASTRAKQESFKIHMYGCESLPAAGPCGMRHVDINVSPLSAPWLWWKAPKNNLSECLPLPCCSVNSFLKSAPGRLDFILLFACHQHHGWHCGDGCRPEGFCKAVRPRSPLKHVGRSNHEGSPWPWRCPVSFHLGCSRTFGMLIRGRQAANAVFNKTASKMVSINLNRRKILIK